MYLYICSHCEYFSSVGKCSLSVISMREVGGPFIIISQQDLLIMKEQNCCDHFKRNEHLDKRESEAFVKAFHREEIS